MLVLNVVTKSVLSRIVTFNTNTISDQLFFQDVAGFLQKFKATEILVGVISKSRCPRLTVSKTFL